MSQQSIKVYLFRWAGSWGEVDPIGWTKILIS